MDPPTESSLLTGIESSTDLTDIYTLFSKYLHPFEPYLERKKPSAKPSKSPDPTTTRSLAKQFLSFLNKSLSLLPKRLSSEAQSNFPSKISQDSAIQLFDIYRLCIRCLDFISSQLCCKPYSIQAQWVRFIHCLEAWGWYAEAENEGFLVLESLKGINFGKLGLKAGKSKAQLIPELSKENGEQDFALLVVETVVTLVKCAFMIQSKNDTNYKRVLTLVDQAMPWIMILDGNAYEKLQRVLVVYMNKITLFMAGNSAGFNQELVLKFCEETFSLYRKSSMKDQMHKFALRICSSIFSQENWQSFSTILINCALSSVAAGCQVTRTEEKTEKVEDENTIVEFLDLVCYCANKCQTATPTVCRAVEEHLRRLACLEARSPLGAIMMLYATGLLIFSFGGRPRSAESTTERYAKNITRSEFLLDYEDEFKQVSISLDILKDFCNIGSNGNILEENRTAYLLSYYNDALKFLCQPLAEFIYAERKEILGARNGASFIANLGITQDAFQQLSYVFLHRHSAAEERNALNKDASEDEAKTLIHIAVAAFTLSLRTGNYIKESVSLVDHLISNDWVQVNGLKYLFAFLYNIAVVLYRNKKVKEASKALKLSCKASWNRLICHCKSNVFHGDMLVDASRALEEAKDFVTEACEKTAFLLDLVYGRSRKKMNKMLIDSLERWSTAKNALELLPPPFVLVKHWVKIEYKLLKDVDVEHGATTLYSLLSSSVNVSKRALSILLEQELLAYRTLNSLNPAFCQKMRMKIIQTLLEKVHVSNDGSVQKSRILIAKGGEIRALGAERLDDCIWHLSEAISSLSDTCSENSCCDSQAHHLMAYALCLRALCSYERFGLSSEVLLPKRTFDDIQNAVNLWLHPHQCHASQSNTMFEEVLKFMHDNHQSDMLFDDMLKLLYHVLDLLSIKGYMEIHPGIYEILICMFKWKKLSLDEALVMLWEHRRVGHALCASPINEVFISKLSEHYGEVAKSLKLWLKCMKPSKPLLVGFQQSFLSILAPHFQGSFCEETSCLLENTEDEVKPAASGLLCPVSPLIRKRDGLLPHVSMDDIKLVASGLISCVPVSSSSVFLSAYLYYDLSDRLILKGQVNEALSHAKEAHRLRSKLFQEKFRCSVDQHIDVKGETPNGFQKHFYGLACFEMYDEVAMEVWGVGLPSEYRGSILTPWNVLQCYLDSTLQVGIIQEMLGNGIEAEGLLRWGKNIALHQHLPLYVIYFSFMLGKLFRKQMLWESAEKELEAASQILAENRKMISCLKCRMFLEVSIDQQLGDLLENRYCITTRNPSTEMLCRAREIYCSALHKLNLSELKNSVCSVEEASADQAEYNSRSHFFNCAKDHLNTRENTSEIERPDLKIKQKRCRKAKKNNLPSSTNALVGGHHLRMTRSRCRSLETKCETISSTVCNGATPNPNTDHLFAHVHAPKHRGHKAESSSSIAHSAREITRLCTKSRCWHCLALQVSKSMSLVDLVHMKWDLVWRRLALMLLIGIGKCLAVLDDDHKTHQIFLLSLSCLVNPFCPKYSSLSCTSLIDLIEKDIPVDVLTIEYAVLLYYICRIALKGHSCKFTRENSCQFSCIEIPRIFSWLKLAFILCSEVPLLFQKVSRLLAVFYVLSTSVKALSLPPTNSLSETYWASFFHQASIGTHLNQQLFSNMMRKPNSKDSTSIEGYHLSSSDFVSSEMDSSLKVAPELLEDLDEFVLRFFQNLPCFTIICITMLGGSDATLLRELLGYPAQAWVLLSRLNSSSQPVVILLPVDSVLEASSVDVSSQSGISSEGNEILKQWYCPWVSGIVDEVAPIFKVLLQENYLSSSTPLEDTKQSRTSWWSKRTRLDNCLGKFLQDLEDSWLGPWRYLLLGDWNNYPGSLEKKLIDDVRLKCEVDVNKDLLKVILSGANYASEIRECGLQLILNRGCYIGGCCEALSNSSPEIKSLSMDVFKAVFETEHALEVAECFGRKPVTLVLDFEVQMLPWENLPILREEEVYRMPSVASICATLVRCCHHQEQLSGVAHAIPHIDPLDSFYLLNPSGDLCRTQLEFENWFKDQKFEGKTGSAPRIEELVAALKSHDLFIYFGHGSGAQYIPGHEIKKLESCAATLLMGCSSGSLSMNGCYAPQGAPLSYILAGSPVIVANLWEVTDKDIDRFGKAMLDAWLTERSVDSVRCTECDMLSDKLRSITIGGSRGNRKDKRSKCKSSNSSDVSVSINCCNHRPKIGSFMGQARKACNLPFLIGASPVCYGVPTGIVKRKEL